MANILFITNGLGFGGAEKMLCFIAESLDERGHKTTIINLKGTKSPIDYERILKSSVIVKTLESKGNVRRILEIKKIANDSNADVIIGFTSYPSMYARIVGTMLGIPSIMSERGDPTQTTGKTLKAKVSVAIINRSKGGVFQTEGARELYGKGLQKRGIVIPNPVFIDGEISYVLYEEREKSIVSVGRLDNFQKRYDVMLDAFKIFSEKHPEYILKLYGRGNDEELIRQWVNERDLTDKVRFMGLTTQPMQDICRDGMFLITSDFEGISNSLLEAMAVGLPCVSTDHTPGGARLLIQDHENGLLAPVADPLGLANAMCEFAEKPSLAAKCGENAKDVVNRFAPEKIIDMWEKYILKLIKH